MHLTSQRGFLLCVLLASAFGVAVWIFDRVTQEPVHKGRKLSLWIQDLNNRTSTYKREQAENAILAIGTNALPIVLKKIQARDSEIRTNFLFQIANFPGVRSWLNVEWMLARWNHHYALSAFSVLETNASPAVPKLAELLSQGMTQCALALSLIGMPARDALIRALDHTNSSVRIASVSALGEIYPTDQKILKCLLDAAFDHEREIRIAAIRILGDLKMEPNLVVPVLVTLLNDREVSKSAEIALQQFGDEALAEHRLLRIRREAGPEMRFLVDQALQEISPITVVRPESRRIIDNTNAPPMRLW